MSVYPFAAIVAADDMALALLLTTIAPEVGGVLVRGEKGTAKSTMVRGLAELLPTDDVVIGCRFSCDPSAPDPQCPDGPHPAASAHDRRPARLVELPVGATEDRVIGSLDISRALGQGEAAFEPGLLAAANRGVLYVDEVNLLHDHLVDLLLDAAAMGRNIVERDGISVTHAARIVLVGTMNPEEGELRPQLLDRFGLTVEAIASRDPAERAEVVRRRLAYDKDAAAFSDRFASEQETLSRRIVKARALLPQVELDDIALTTIARVCAGFDVDGLRADIVTARAARAHAVWNGRLRVTREDIRAAARLALPHRRRRKPFDAPGLDEDLLDELLGDEAPPTEPDEGPRPDPDDPVSEQEPDAEQDAGPDTDQGHEPEGPNSQDPSIHSESHEHEPPQPQNDSLNREPESQTSSDAGGEGQPLIPAGVATATGDTYRTNLVTVRGLGEGDAGKRSRAVTSYGRTVGHRRPGENTRGRVHLPATIAAAANRRATPESTATSAWVQRWPSRLEVTVGDLRMAVTEGREANLVLFAVDTSGSMAARKRMGEVKTAVLSLLLDAYQRRDRVGLVTFRAQGAELALPPTSSVDAAARCLQELPHGGRTPVAEGLLRAAEVLRVERIRDPRRRALFVLVTDGRATAGPEALRKARVVAAAWPATQVDAVVVDCETGRFRMGLARELSQAMGARHLAVEDLAAQNLVDVVDRHRAEPSRAAPQPSPPSRDTRPPQAA